MKLAIVFAVVLGVFALSAVATPECDEFKARLSETAAGRLYLNCQNGLDAWFCPCLSITSTTGGSTTGGGGGSTTSVHFKK